MAEKRNWLVPLAILVVGFWACLTAIIITALVYVPKESERYRYETISYSRNGVRYERIVRIDTKTGESENVASSLPTSR